MIDHVSIGVRDIAKAKAFYDAALKPLGYACLSPGESSLGYGGDAARFWLNLTESPVPPDTKSGLHFCFAAPSRESSAPSIAPRSRQVGETTANPVCGKSTGPIISPPSSSIPTATGSRLTPAARVERNGLDSKGNRDEGEARRRMGGHRRHRGAAYAPRSRLRRRYQARAGARVVTFGNGMVVREPIVTIDGASRRLVWTAKGGRTTHYNASVQVFSQADGTTAVVWIADFLPDEMANSIAAAMEGGMSVMKKTLDRLER